MWKSRDSQLRRVPGFRSFHLLKGEPQEGYRLYASHTAWASEAAFRDWTRSEAFRTAHQNAGEHRDIYLGHPELEVFESIQSVEA